MTIQFYIPLPPIEFFTWLAIYMQLNMMVFMVIGNLNREIKSFINISLYLFVASLVIVPLILFAMVTDWKGSKLYWHRYWMETPEERNKRNIGLYRNRNY